MNSLFNKKIKDNVSFSNLLLYVPKHFKMTEIIKIDMKGTLQISYKDS